MKGLKEMRTLKTGSKKTRAVVILALVIAGSVIGVAIAAWTTGGSGSGQASAGTAASMTISAGTPSTNLYPTASADVAAVVSNPNPYKVHVSSVSLGAVTVDGGHSALQHRRQRHRHLTTEQRWRGLGCPRQERSRERQLEPRPRERDLDEQCRERLLPGRDVHGSADGYGREHAVELGTRRSTRRRSAGRWQAVSNSVAGPAG